MDRLSDYDYVLPEELIAQHPLENRSASRLLHIDRKLQKISHLEFASVIEHLNTGDLLVFNNTRVSALRLFGHKKTGGKVESLLLQKGALPNQYIALVRPGKRLQPGAIVEYENGLCAEIIEDLGDGKKLLAFDCQEDLSEVLRQIGLVPLPHYIKAKLNNPERYQTVYAKVEGSAAAPTAGLHFTPEILKLLKKKGVETAFVTLDVGIDTFRPIQVENINDFQMHGEKCTISEQTATQINRCKGKIIGVGTTAVRTVESFAVGNRKVEFGSKITNIFIRPGYKFQIIDGMFTNFHMPRTTMLVMLSALAGRELIFKAYKEAIESKYRFLSFGDSMLIQ